jgi:uncharacterized protein
VTIPASSKSIRAALAAAQVDDPGRRPRPAFQQAFAGPLPETPDLGAFLPGFWQDTPAGAVFTVQRRFALDARHGAYQLGAALDIQPGLLSRLTGSSTFPAVTPEAFLYLDTETSRLPEGAGTFAFLTGIGRFVDGWFELRQYFLDAPEREPALLSAVTDHVQRSEALVTYNGSAFDLPLLDARYAARYGLLRMTRGRPHLDLLVAARRLYRDRFRSCRLADIEQQLLGVTRSGDVPSMAVPALYFRFQRDRRFRALLPVFEHNAMDVLSLVSLAVYLNTLCSGKIALQAEDQFMLARVCDQNGESDDAAERYAAALALGLPASTRELAERRLSSLYKTSGRWDEAVEIWFRIAYRPQNALVFPLIELASYCERRRHDPEAAITHLEHALELLRRHHLRLGARGAEAQAATLTRRIARLRERASRLAGRSAP